MSAITPRNVVFLCMPAAELRGARKLKVECKAERAFTLSRIVINRNFPHVSIALFVGDRRASFLAPAELFYGAGLVPPLNIRVRKGAKVSVEIRDFRDFKVPGYWSNRGGPWFETLRIALGGVAS